MQINVFNITAQGILYFFLLPTSVKIDPPGIGIGKRIKSGLPWATDFANLYKKFHYQGAHKLCRFFVSLAYNSWIFFIEWSFNSFLIPFRNLMLMVISVPS